MSEFLTTVAFAVLGFFVVRGGIRQSLRFSRNELTPHERQLSDAVQRIKRKFGLK